MRRIGDRPLWIGHAGDLRDARAVMAHGFDAVVELADNEPFAELPRGLIRVRVPLSDDGENRPDELRLATNTLATLIRDGYEVLVCCSNGLSRSVCLTAAGIALAERRSLGEALFEVASAGPADVSPGLYAAVLQAIGWPLPSSQKSG